MECGPRDLARQHVGARALVLTFAPAFASVLAFALAALAFALAAIAFAFVLALAFALAFALALAFACVLAFASPGCVLAFALPSPLPIYRGW